jgi:hypothetical protein
MPLRDHFHAPIIHRHSWEAFHATWPVKLVDRLAVRLPEGFVVEPHVHLGRYYELDFGAFESESPIAGGRGGVATFPRTAPKPTMTTELDIGECHEYEVLVYDMNRDRRLVAAVEFVSPANKDRPEHRQAFVAKCVAMLQKNVCVAIVDLVTTRTANLYGEMLEVLGRTDSLLEPEPPGIYAVSCRTRSVKHSPQFETWFYPFVLGQPLPDLPIWLEDDLHVMLELDGAYEDTCRTLRIA